MAKAGFWMRGAKGKIADAVFRKGRNGTVMAEFVAPKNPKTRLQMAQRIIFATVNQARSKMNAIIDHSFEGLGTKEANLAQFTRLNIAKLRSGMAQDYAEGWGPEDAKTFLTTKNISALIPNTYIMSRGSAVYNGTVVYRNKELTLTNASASYTFDREVQVGDVLKVLFGISKANQQITVCLIANPSNSYAYTYGDTETQAPGFQIANTRFFYGRIVLKNNADLEAPIALGAQQAWPAIEGVIDSEKTSAELFEYLKARIAITVDSDGFTTSVNDAATLGLNVLGGCIIFSELDGQKWLRNNAEMKIEIPQIDDAANALNFGLWSGIALEAWYENLQVADTTKYLEEGGQRSGNFPT